MAEGTVTGIVPVPVTLDRISRAMSAALADVDSLLPGAKKPIRFYFDTDVIQPAVVGTDNGKRPTDYPLTRRDTIRWTVRALWTGGYLPTAHLLAPHLHEVMKPFLEHQGDGASAVAATLLDCFDPKLVERMITDSERATTPEGEERFQRTLRDLGIPSFLAAEFRQRALKKRLHSLLHEKRVLSFDHTGDPIEQLEEDPRYSRIRDALNKVRPDFKQNNRHDALAVVSLIRLARRGERVRFYTHTDDLKYLCLSDPDLAGALSESSTPAQYVDDINGVIRSSLYFEWLAILYLIKSGHDFKWPAVSNLPFIWQRAGDLAATVARGSQSKHGTVNGVIVTDAVRSELMTCLRRLRSDMFFRTFWAHDRSPVRELIPLKRSGVSDPPMYDRLRFMFDTSVKQFPAFEQRIQSLSERATTIPENPPDPLDADFIPSRDLALVRWLPDPQRLDASISDLCARLRPSTHAKREEAKAELKDLVAKMPRANQRDLAVSSACLWCVEQYALLAALLEDIAKVRPNDIGLGLRLMGVAASLKAASTGEMGQSCLAQFRHKLEGETAIPRHVHLGSAYILYLVARLIWQSSLSTARAIANESIQSACSALSGSASDTIDAFAVDHVCYVYAGMFRQSPPEEWYDKLRGIRGTTLWHYRFQDTYLLCDLLAAMSQLEQSHSAEVAVGIRDRIQGICAEYDSLYEKNERAEIQQNREEAYRALGVANGRATRLGAVEQVV